MGTNKAKAVVWCPLMPSSRPQQRSYLISVQTSPSCNVPSTLLPSAMADVRNSWKVWNSSRTDIVKIFFHLLWSEWNDGSWQQITRAEIISICICFGSLHSELNEDDNSDSGINIRHYADNRSWLVCFVLWNYCQLFLLMKRRHRLRHRRSRAALKIIVTRAQQEFIPDLDSSIVYFLIACQK